MCAREKKNVIKKIYAVSVESYGLVRSQKESQGACGGDGRKLNRGVE